MYVCVYMYMCIYNICIHIPPTPPNPTRPPFPCIPRPCERPGVIKSTHLRQERAGLLGDGWGGGAVQGAMQLAHGGDHDRPIRWHMDMITIGAGGDQAGAAPRARQRTDCPVARFMNLFQRNSPHRTISVSDIQENVWKFLLKTSL